MYVHCIHVHVYAMVEMGRESEREREREKLTGFHEPSPLLIVRVEGDGKIVALLETL